MSRTLRLLLAVAACCRPGPAAGDGPTPARSYDVALTSAAGDTQVTVRCDRDVNETQWSQNISNDTFYKVTVNLSRACNGSNFNFTFPLMNATSLILSNNSLINFTLSVDVSVLQELNLSSNRLRLIPATTFNNMTNLKKLDLSRNDIINIHPETFNGLSRLEFLDLSANSISALSSALTPLSGLQHLNLSGNRIEVIHKSCFKSLQLQHLDVSHNGLRRVSPGALQALPNLARLRLGDNPRLGGPALLVGSGRRLQQLDAARTGLRHVPEAFTHSVRFLSLAGNGIASVRRGDLDSYPLLQSLGLAGNRVAAVEDDALGRLEMLLLLDLNENALASVPRPLPAALEYLSMKDNALRNLSVGDLRSLPNLRVLLLPNNRIAHIEDHAFDDLPALETLDLSNNPLKALSRGTFEGPASLQDLRLCRLALPPTDGFPLPAPARVAMLHLAGSPGLARALLADAAALAALSQLQYLDLRMNRLPRVRSDLLFYLGQLRTLRLHGNAFNCTAELWLRDWLNWNGSLTDGETCYYSTADVKEAASKYNCTFPETFTISETLPPVNLYSTEMINKLLRYYGYLGNKTEEVSHKRDKEKFDEETRGGDAEGDDIEDNTLDNVLRITNRSLRKEIMLSNNETNRETLKSEKANWYSKEDLKRLQNEHTFNNRFLDIESNTNTPKDIKSNSIDEARSTRRKYRSGKRLNTPVNTTKKVKPNDQYKPVSTSATDKSVTAVAENTTILGTHIEFSPYQSPAANYAPFVGTAAVCSLVVVALALWASFRLRHRRRPRETEPREQIEVSSISGGVLW